MDVGSVSRSEEFEERGFCISQPLVGVADLEQARQGIKEVLAGRYETGRPPVYRSWYPGRPATSLIKIDMPHLANHAIRSVVACSRVGQWVAETLLASFIQVWACELFLKAPGGDRRAVIGWHQDDHAWPHWDGEVVTAWLALDDVDLRAGPLRYVVGSHHWGSNPDATSFFDPDLEGQRSRIHVPDRFDWIEDVALLRAGAVTLHHRCTLHASGPNDSLQPRLGLAIHLRTERSRLVEVDPPPLHWPQLGDEHASPVVFNRMRDIDQERMCNEPA